MIAGEKDGSSYKKPLTIETEVTYILFSGKRYTVSTFPHIYEQSSEKAFKAHVLVVPLGPPTLNIFKTA